jgi:hypothetical protein
MSDASWDIRSTEGGTKQKAVIKRSLKIRLIADKYVGEFSVSVVVLLVGPNWG